MGYRINVIVSPNDCSTCHPVEAQQYSGSKKGHAWKNIMSNPLYHTLVSTIDGLKSVDNGKIVMQPPTPHTLQETCLGCHGTRVEVKGMKKVYSSSAWGEIEVPNLTNWPSQGVGRENPDGSIGACSSCHPRHSFSIKIARQPETFGQCHLDPDVPAYNVFKESKHGNIYDAFKSETSFTNVPWVLGKDFKAPTCATCHNSLVTTPDGTVIAERTHDFGSRLWSDDGGATEAIALFYGDRIRYLRKENGGVASVLNLGIREMRGDCFSWLSHDDVYLPRKGGREVAALGECGRDAVVYSDYEVVDAASRHVEVFRAGRISAPQFRMLLVTDIPVNGCTVLVPRRCFGQAGLFDERLKATQDYDLWFRMAGAYPFLHVPEVLVRSRMHAGQGTRRMPSTCLAEGNANFTQWLDELARDQSPSPDPDLTRFFLRAAVRLKRRGYIPAAEHALRLYRRRAGGGVAREGAVWARVPAFTLNARRRGALR